MMKSQNSCRPFTVGVVALCAVALSNQYAHAHFLWAQMDSGIRPTLRLTFAQASGEKTEDGLLDRLKTAAVWNEKGDKIKLAPSVTAWSGTIESGSHLSAASQNYGVLDKTKAGRGVYLLEYNAKATNNVSKAGLNARLPLELFARPVGDEILVTLKHKGQPVPFGAVTLHTPNDGKGQGLTTDAQGQLRFKAETEGLYGLRAGVAETKSGEFGGKKYNLIRRYTTLSFPVASALKIQAIAATTPVKMGNEQADPQAYRLLEAAHDARQVMPDNFGGYRAKVFFKDGDKSYEGIVTYNRKAKEAILLEVTGLDEDTKAWLEDTVGNQIGHRRGGSFAQGDGRHPISLGGSENDFGTLVKLNDRLKSEYRIKDNKVTEVTREMGDTRFTISVLETQTTDSGKYLSKHFTVVYRNTKTGAITQMDGFRDAYTQWNGVWLPTQRTVVTFGNKETPRTRTIRYSEFQPLGVN